MNYYLILAASHKFHGHKPLTYQHDSSLEIGSLVIVPLKNIEVTGIVIGKTVEPDFDVKAIKQVLALPSLPKITLDLLNWCIEYYPAPLGFITSLFVPSNIDTRLANFGPSLATQIKTHELPKLTADQAKALKDIRLSGKKSFVLHGDTATGKTRIYVELAKQQLSKAKSVLILTPEIGLTPQLVAEVEKSVGQTAIVIHSGLSAGQKREAWLNILFSKAPVVVIGPRSALFAPFGQLGLVIIDEAHDSAYKQDQAPYYQTIRLAAKLAALHQGTFIIGTATPNISDYYIAIAKQTPVLRMTDLAVKNSAAAKEIELVDSKDRSLFSRNPYLSDSLLKALEATLANKEQALIFLNRRGTARQVLCQSCGWQALCPNCDLPLTFHADSFVFRCHTCGYKTEACHNCPVCGSSEIIYRSVGTKAITEMLERLFPNARIQRFDSDSKKAERLESHYQQLASGQIDILVGTQILVKGLDLPRLSLVGVLTADSSLSFPDFTAEERTYQLIYQLIGRVGRGHLAGQAVIQTYRPNSSAIKAAIAGDWQTFYNNQIKEREKYLFPPFCYLLKLSCSRKTSASAQKSSLELKQKLNSLGLKIQVIGPSPSFREKSAKGYSWQLVIKTKDRNNLLKVIKSLPSGWAYDIDPSNLL